MVTVGVRMCVVRPLANGCYRAWSAGDHVVVILETVSRCLRGSVNLESGLAEAFAPPRNSSFATNILGTTGA